MPEAALSRDIHERYHSVLVVPAFLEAPDLFEGYRAALLAAPGRVLVVLVVNAAAPQAEAAWPENARLLAAARSGRAARQLSASPRAWLSQRDECDVLSIDRAGPGRCLPDGDGVGLARRIGCDLALALWAAGQIEVPLLYCTDADAELPSDYFGALLHGVPEEIAAAVFEFWHVPSGDSAIDAATAVYELGLRYYVAGLAAARSPYAYHSIGSTLVVHACAYAGVRGFPRRLAGEDFYLLNKAAKLGAIWRVDDCAVRLASRPSLRTAHGTGVSAVKLAADAGPESATFYHPEIFGALQTWLTALRDFALSRDIDAARSLVQASPYAEPLGAALSQLNAWAALEEAARHTRSGRALEQRLHQWFDAFRTLKLVHALRASAFPSLPFRIALGQASFVPSASALARVDELRERFRDAERRRPKALGAVAGDTFAVPERAS